MTTKNDQTNEIDKLNNQLNETKLDKLPEIPQNIAGETTTKGDGFNLRVSNAQGYLCHISLDVVFPCEPALLFSIFKNPDNSKLFRDIKAMPYRRVVFDDPRGLKVVEVEQIAEVRVLPLVKLDFTTRLKVTEDERDPKQLQITFEIISSDIMTRFGGHWVITQIPSESDPRKICAKCTLEQDVLPKGMPLWLKHIPVLGSILRGVSARAVRRMMEDLANIIQRVNEGEQLDSILKPVDENEVKVQSHTLFDFDVDEENEEAVKAEEDDQAEKDEESQGQMEARKDVGDVKDSSKD